MTETIEDIGPLQLLCLSAAACGCPVPASTATIGQVIGRLCEQELIVPEYMGRPPSVARVRITEKGSALLSYVCAQASTCVMENRWVTRSKFEEQP